MNVDHRTSNLKRLAVAGAAFTLASTLAPQAALAQGRTVSVVMTNMTYGPLPNGLHRGDTIIWINHDSVMHTATARNGAFDVRLRPGQSAQTVLRTSGNIDFYCIFHTQMRGTLRVADR